MEYSSFHIDLGPYTSCVHRFGDVNNAPCVILIHGSIENSRVFYSKSGKGFAPWLSSQGFDVYAVDLPGKGKSEPQVSRSFQQTQTKFITEELPKIIEEISARNNSGVLHLGAHSWGGVLIASMLARKQIAVDSMVFFASKRRISVFSLKRIIAVDFIWSLVGTISAYLVGYLPAKFLRIGSDNEPKDFFLQTNNWVYRKKWVDPEDGFDYKKALSNKPVPPTLFLTGINDRVLGNPIDVEVLMNEMPDSRHEFKILGKNYGNRHNYDHIDILTHKAATEDHFPEVVQWFRQFGGIS